MTLLGGKYALPTLCLALWLGHGVALSQPRAAAKTKTPAAALQPAAAGPSAPAAAPQPTAAASSATAAAPQPTAAAQSATAAPVSAAPAQPQAAATAQAAAPAPGQPSAPQASALTPAPAAAAPAAARPRWTAADVARVRAMLQTARLRRAHPEQATPLPPAQQPQPPAAAPVAVVHGNAGSAWALGASIDAVFHNDRGYDLFANDDVAPRFGLWLGHDLFSFSRQLILAAELGWGVESESQTGLFAGVVNTNLVTHTFFGAASLRWELLPWLQPQARLALGASAVHMEFTSLAEPTDRANAVSPMGSLGAGVFLRTPTRLFENARGELASLSFGVLVEGGYALRGPVDFSLTQQHGARQIPVSAAKLGELGLSGAYIRTSLVVRY